MIYSYILQEKSYILFTLRIQGKLKRYIKLEEKQRRIKKIYKTESQKFIKKKNRK